MLYNCPVLIKALELPYEYIAVFDGEAIFSRFTCRNCLICVGLFNLALAKLFSFCYNWQGHRTNGFVLPKRCGSRSETEGLFP